MAPQMIHLVKICERVTVIMNQLQREMEEVTLEEGDYRAWRLLSVQERSSCELGSPVAFG